MQLLLEEFFINLKIYQSILLTMIRTILLEFQRDAYDNFFFSIQRTESAFKAISVAPGVAKIANMRYLLNGLKQSPTSISIGFERVTEICCCAYFLNVGTITCTSLYEFAIELHRWLIS